jgi:uncharacterized repeat protein (TIGR02543 family)
VKKKTLSLLLTMCLLIGILPLSAAMAEELGSVMDFQGDGFTLSTGGTYPWVVEDKNGENVLTATYGETANPISTLTVVFTETGVFSFDYSTATVGTRDVLLFSFEEITSSTDYGLAENSDNKSAYSGTHDWTTTQVNVTAGQTLYFVFAKKTTNEGHVWLRNLVLTTDGFTVSAESSDTDFGTAVASASSVAADAVDKTVTFTATPVNGGHFYGWVDGNGHFVSAEAVYTAEIQTNTSLTAWFGAEDQYEARVDGTFYTSIEDAISNASGTASSPAFVVMTSNAEIDDDVVLNANTVLVVPYSDLDASVDLRINTSDRPYANSREASTASTTLTPQGQNVTYTLTIADGASLTVPSTSVLSVGGVYSGKQPIGGQVCGAHSEIDVEGTLNVSGILSCCGYVYGDGELNVMNGVVYENFTVTDFNGGAIFMEDATMGLFPFTTYTVMGIQCQTSFDADSYLKAYCALYVSSTIMQIPVEVVGGNDALIQISSGEAVINYNESKSFTVTSKNGTPLAEIGTLEIKINGDGAVGSMKLTLGSMAFNTQEFECPLPYCITIEQESGTLDITAKLKIMPGSEIKIDEGATLNIGYGGSLNALIDSTTASNNTYKYPQMEALMANGYYPVAEVVVAGTLNVEDGAGIGGLIFVQDGGEVAISEYADTDINATNISMLMNVTDSELTVGTPEFMQMMQQFSGAMQNNDPEAMAALMERAQQMEGGNTYTADEGGFTTDGYEEQTHEDTITFVDDDYLTYVTEHGSAEGYVPLAEFTQARHTALVYPNEAPAKEPVPYATAYQKFVFNGWYKILINPLGQLYADDEHLYAALPEVEGNAIYMASYEEVWVDFVDYTLVFDDGVETEAIEVPGNVVFNFSAAYSEIAEPVRSGYTFDGWEYGDAMLWNADTLYVYDVEAYADANRVITLTARWTKAAPAQSLTEEDFADMTKAAAAVAIDPEQDGVFTVTCPKACVVIIETDKGGVKSYVKVPYTEKVAENTYSFEAHLTEGQKVLVALKGDINGDGGVDLKDAMLAMQTYSQARTATELELLVGRFEDGAMSLKDAMKIMQIYSGAAAPADLW